MVRILPFELTDLDQIPGYRIGQLAGPDVETNSYAPDTAVTLALDSSSPADSFKSQEDAGLVVGVAQRLVSTTDRLASATLDVRLFTGSSTAAAYATGQSLPPVSSGTTPYTPVTLTRSIGDVSAGWHAGHYSTGFPNPQQYEHYQIRWQHGPLVFTLETPSLPGGRIHQEDAEQLASQLDAIEATRPALDLSPATVAAPATEAQRFQAGLQLKAFFAPACAAPAGFLEGVGGASIYHPADWVQEDSDPAAALRRVDGQWKELIEAQQILTSEQDATVTMACQAVISASAEGASTDMADFVPPSGWSFAPIDAPVTLGDSTLAYRADGIRGDGDPGDQLAIFWTHGPIFLAVYMDGPSGTTSIDALAAFGQLVEAHFQANPILAIGAGSLP